MIKSMTGFGQATGGRLPFKWAVEIRSWNHRFFDCSTRLPNVLSSLDERIRDLVHLRVKRGKITVAVSFRSRQAESNGLILDEEKVDAYIRALRRIQKRHHLKEPISVGALLGVPNLFTVDHKEYSIDQYWASLKPVLEQAVKRLLSAKAKEGLALMHDIKKRVGLLATFLGRIKSVSKNVPVEYRNRLQERVLKLTGNVALDSGRLEQEVALAAERSDITEELVRTEHHLDFLNASLVSSDEAGKKLDFIAQEIQREANTIASKAQSFEVSESVIRIKGELEKIREQVQNIE